MNPQFFPTLLIILDLAAAAVWASNHNWRQVVYWTAASILTCSVTY